MATRIHFLSKVNYLVIVDMGHGLTLGDAHKKVSLVLQLPFVSKYL